MGNAAGRALPAVGLEQEGKGDKLTCAIKPQILAVGAAKAVEGHAAAEEVVVDLAASVALGAVEGVWVAVAVVGENVAGKVWDMEKTRKDNNKETAVFRALP